MISVTTPTLDGQRIAAYHGIVTGDAVMGTNIFADWFASIRDIVGGRSGSYEKVLQAAKDEAIREMEERASHLGANAVIGVRLDISAIGGDSKTLLVVSASGTAVRLG